MESSNPSTEEFKRVQSAQMDQDLTVRSLEEKIAEFMRKVRLPRTAISYCFPW